MPKQKTNWLVDAFLFLGFQLSFFLDLTGLSLHQWLGVFISALALYHLLLHWKWVAAVTKRFWGNTSHQCRIYYLLDGMILLSFLLIGLSGIWISTWLDLELANYIFWKDLHVYSSIASLGLIFIKVAAHWRWIVKNARKYFGLWKVPVPVSSPAGTTSKGQYGSMNRKEFLQLMGVAGVASLISAANLVDIGQAAGSKILKEQTTPPQLPDTNLMSSNNSGESCQVICDKGCTYPGQCRRYIDQNKNGICDLTECNVTEPLSAVPEESGGSQNEADSSSADTASCSVLCQKGCTYPGDCPDYIDLNNSGLCDYGECLASNTGLELPSSSHSGGGGRQRRGNR